MFPRKIKTLEFSGKKIEVHDLTVAEVEDILQRLNNTFVCPHGLGKVTPEQCEANRKRSRLGEIGQTKPMLEACKNCTEWEALCQEVYRKESEVSSISFLFKDLDEYIIKLTTGLSEEEIKQMPEHVLAKVREAIRELNPFFSKAVDELLETARKLQEKTLQNS